MKGLLADLAPLRSSRAFAALWVGASFAGLGTQIATLAVLAQMWAMTRSPIWSGAIGLATAIPILFLCPIGGNLADSRDRRSIVRITTLLQAGTAMALCVQAFAGNHSPILLLLVVAANAAAGAFGSPARRTLPARLLPVDQLGAAYSLLNLSFQFSMLIGPALGGLLMAWNLPAAYVAHVVAAAISLTSLALLPPLRPTRASDTAGASGKGAGWSLVFRTRTLQGAFASDIAAMALAMPIAVFPLINQGHFNGDPRTLGFFLSAIAVGGVTAGIFSGSIARARRLGRIMLIAATGWGMAIALFGLATPIWAALGLLAVAGAVDTIAVISRGVLVQLEAPDHSRGRVSAAEHIVGVAAPEIGNFRGGLLANAVGASASIVIGGVSATLVTILIVLTNRPVRAYRTPDHEPTPASG